MFLTYRLQHLEHFIDMSLRGTLTLLRHLMLVDQAGWHRSKELQVSANIRLIEQPAYSPEVNPVKHVWEELR